MVGFESESIHLIKTDKIGLVFSSTCDYVMSHVIFEVQNFKIQTKYILSLQ